MSIAEKPRLRGFTAQWKKWKKPSKKSKMQPKPDPGWLTEMLDFQKDREEVEGPRDDPTIDGIGFLKKKAEYERAPPPAHFRTGWVPPGEPKPTADLESLRNLPPLRTWAPGSTRPPREGPPPKTLFQKRFGVWDEEGNMLEPPEPLPDWREGIDFGEGSNLTLKHTLNQDNRRRYDRFAIPGSEDEPEIDEGPKPRTFLGAAALPEDEHRFLAGLPLRSPEEIAADTARAAEEAARQEMEDNAAADEKGATKATFTAVSSLAKFRINSPSLASRYSQSHTAQLAVATVFVVPLAVLALVTYRATRPVRQVSRQLESVASSISIELREHECASWNMHAI